MKIIEKLGLDHKRTILVSMHALACYMFHTLGEEFAPEFDDDIDTTEDWVALRDKWESNPLEVVGGMSKIELEKLAELVLEEYGEASMAHLDIGGDTCQP